MLEFFLQLYKEGCLYSGLCAASSALASAIAIPGYSSISEHPKIVRFLKGIYNRHPPLPKYVKIWDINDVLCLYNQLPDNQQLSIKDLSHKLAILLMLLGARRKNSLSNISVDNIEINNTEMVIIPHEVLKHTRPGIPIKPITYKRYELNDKLCVVRCMEVYLQRRSTLVGNEVKQLFITYRIPHKPATIDTISRWIKSGLQSAGVDIKAFQAHRCRAAAVSKAKRLGVKTEDILKKGCWSSDNTFMKFYDKDIIGTKPTEDEFIAKLLSNIS